jgi:hypothetical protein
VSHVHRLPDDLPAAAPAFHTAAASGDRVAADVG